MGSTSGSLDTMTIPIQRDPPTILESLEHQAFLQVGICLIVISVTHSRQPDTMPPIIKLQVVSFILGQGRKDSPLMRKELIQVIESADLGKSDSMSANDVAHGFLFQ